MDDILKKLKDIKAEQNVSIDLTNYYIVLGLLTLIIVFTLVLYFYLKYKNKKLTKKQIAKTYLQNLNFENSSKTIAYEFTLYGLLCVKEENFDTFNNIVNKLEIYKYKKNVDNITNALNKDMKNYIKENL